MFLCSFLGSAKQNHQNDASADEHEQFKRLERHGYRPVVFPTSSPVEQSRRVRWPNEPRSNPVNPMSIVVFPRSETSSDTQTIPNTDIETVASILVHLSDMNSTNANNDSIEMNNTNELNEINESSFGPLAPNSVNNSAYVTDSGLVASVYIDDNGIFQVKHVAKGENGSSASPSNETSETSSASINKTEDTAIMPNDTQQIPSQPNQTTIDLIQNAAINNTKMIFEWDGAATATPQQPARSEEADKQPALYKGRPIFT